MSRLDGLKFHSDFLTTWISRMGLSTFSLKCAYSSPQSLYIAFQTGPQFVSRPEDQKRCMSSTVNGLVLVLSFCFASFLSTYPAIPFLSNKEVGIPTTVFIFNFRFVFIVYETIQQPLPVSSSVHHFTFLVLKNIIFFFIQYNRRKL